MIEVNKFQTQLTDEYINSLKEECRTDLLDMINNVEFIQRLISPNRKYAKDLERDSSGRIKVDLVNPHIITDSDYFRQAAIHFQKHGCYTKLMPNPNPQSEYGQWLKREVMRCWNGMVRESDGEWITGDMYFYLNYFPIIQTKIKKGSKVGERVIDFPEMWEGVYWRFHYWHQARYGGMYDDFVGGKHCIEIASRGRSKSYSFGAKLTKNFVLGENELNRRNVKSLVAAYQKEYLIKDGTLNKFIDGITHCAKYTQFPSARLKASMSDLNWKAGFIDADTQLEAGTLNEVLGVAVKDDSDKLRGKRSSWLGFEEFAAFAKFLETWQTCMPNVQEGDISFGQMSGIGTGGSSGNDFMGALEMLNYPDGYRVYSLPNYWDKGSQGKKKTVFFYPGYVNSKGYYNEDGVSDVVGALISEIEYRINLKYNSSDPLQLTRRKAETAFTIQDAIMKRDGSLYPTDKLNDVINEINLNPKYTDDMWIGRLSLSKSGEVEYKPDNDLKYITEFPHKDNKIAGACCIFKMPIKNSSGSVPWGRYIAGCDPYDDDSSDTLSLMSMFILDLWTDEIVFEYTGRPMFAEDAYENIRLALLMYNCEMNYENNKKGLFNHFSKHNSLYLLSDTLEFLKDKDMAKPGLYGNKQKGTANYGNGEKAIAPYARRCIRDYLLKSQSTNVFKEIDGETIQETISVFNYQNIKSKALLQELAMWSADGNYDRCVTSGTKILTDNGYCNVEDIKQDDFVVTMDGKINNVYLTHENFNNKPIVEIGVLGQFNKLSCTENHPIFIKRYDKKPSGRNWFKIKNNIPDTRIVDASDVKIGDYVFIPKRKNLVDIGISDDLKYLLGWILGDGYISKSSNTVNIFFQGNQLDLAEKCKKIILENFNDSTIDSVHDYNWNGNVSKRHTVRAIKINPRITKDKNENMYKLNIQNKEFHSFVTKYISDSSNKTILKNTFNSSNMLWFFIGYFEADGHYRTGTKNDGSVRSNLSVVSTNYDEIIKIRQMLIDNDIWCSVRRKDARIYDCKRTNKKYQAKESYNIEVCGMHSIDIVSNSLKFKRKGLPVGGNRNSFLKVDDGYWVPVNSLSKVDYDGVVYNLSVENNNTYIANGITTHNCDALAMLMLLREDKLRLLGDTSARDAGQNRDVGYLGKDSFFEKNYRKNDLNSTRSKLKFQ